METFDVLVIGAGPAGMMAAAKAGEKGAKVILVEKNLSPGVKLLLTGNGRCNLTQDEFDLPALTAKYGKSGKFLFPAFSRFGPKQVMDFFEARGVALKIEPGGKVFPKSNRASEVLDALFGYLRESNVAVKFDSPVKALVANGGKIQWIIAGDEKFVAGNYIIATGGKSYARTGSTGEGFGWLKELGHSVTDLMPGLAPVKVRERWVSRLQGLSLKDVQIDLRQENEKRGCASGDLVFTHFGLSGPAILDLSGAIGALLKSGPVVLSIDLMPRSELSELDSQLLAIFRDYRNKMIKNCVFGTVPARLSEMIIAQAAIDPDKKGNAVSREDRQNLARLFKNLELTVVGTLGFDQAMVTIGGVLLKEIDPNTMRSKLVENLFLAGEVLNLAGPSGGYNLQICWSTGFLAGNCVAQAGAF